MAVAIINAIVACRRPELDWMRASTLIRLRALPIRWWELQVRARALARRGRPGSEIRDATGLDYRSAPLLLPYKEK
jgi:hypothetical protein